MAKGGAFEGDEAPFLRFKLGGGDVIPGLDQAVRGMKASIGCRV